MAGETLSASLPIIVDDIRGRSYKYLVHTGVMRQLVKPCGVGSNGDYYVEPIWDPTGVTATHLHEGTDFTDRQSYVNATRGFDSTEWGVYTYITDNVKEDARESVTEEHSRAHGISHARRIEEELVDTFASFTGTITASATDGLDMMDIAAAKATMIGQVKDPGGDLSFVCHPYQWQWLVNNTTNNANYGVLGDLGNTVLNKYLLSKVLGDVNCYYSNYISEVNGTTHTRNAGMFVKDTVGIFVPRDYRIESQRFITERATKLVSTVRFGSRVRFPAFGVKVVAIGDTPA